MVKAPEKANPSPCKVRNVSLPNLKIRRKNSKSRIDKEKRKAKKRKGVENSKPLKKKKEDDWDEIFFHYFEEYLDRYIE